MLATSSEQDAFMFGYLFAKYGLIIGWWIATAPLYWVVKKSGKSRWWAALLIVPLAGFIVLVWILAFSPWRRATPDLTPQY